MKLLLLSGEDLRAALPMPAAIDAMADAFAAITAGAVDAPPRVAVPSEGGVSLLMGARAAGALATKVVSVFPGNADRGRPVVSGLAVALDPATGEPDAVLDGTALTAWRTGAAGGAAARLLAPADAKVGAVIGSGAQAETQLLALDAALALEEVRVASRDRARAAALVARVGPQVRARLVDASTADEAADGAHVLVTATTATTPVVRDAALAAAAHVTAVGTFRPAHRELEAATVGRARVFVDERAAAAEEAGDLLLAESEGATRRDDWTELGAVAAGDDPGRRDGDALTLFKSVGHAAQDAFAAARAVAAARAAGLGRELEL